MVPFTTPGIEERRQEAMKQRLKSLKDRREVATESKGEDRSDEAES
ncbi:hypothetical protein [Ruegeria sp. HKCCA4812]|nr:hypothetical protein [Ruegeria sp. HKCCA4812]